MVSVTLRVLFAVFILFFPFVPSSAHRRYMTDKPLRIYAYCTIPAMIIFTGIIVEGLTKDLYSMLMYYITLLNIFITYLLIAKHKVKTEKDSIAIETRIMENNASSNEVKEFEVRLLH